MTVLAKSIILDFIAGDENAFAQIYSLYYQDIKAYCFKHTRSYETAEELVSDVFLKFWEARAQFDPEREIRPYLLTITKNVTFTWLKRMLTDQKMKTDFRGRYLSDQDGANQDVVMTAAMDLGRLRKAMGQHMPVRRREVFELCKIEGLSYSEAANVLSISKETVKEHMSLARKDMSRLADAADYLYLLIPVLTSLNFIF
ncbi:RNA polymerase sigma-70 factor, ECF subfamily [Pedobacter westerhofensis]|uniref:RNA polymerase sigma-70 factor, ECF subfamily n=1 Tax=Pedobacter westerhofensis TaxID=425512 RepID=A0A521AIF1_9SPHI|nr:sigma-70 family RNA polymerase sigma factor [Pedobacter westerhofensis]SMO34528.1 RNA polymerase sigma-70 factor, ECF subfamily [Pedobacter westerhofensis]